MAALQGKPLRSLKGIFPCWRTAHDPSTLDRLVATHGALGPLTPHDRLTIRRHHAHIPFHWQRDDLPATWVAFRYGPASAWRIPGRPGTFLVMRACEEHAMRQQKDVNDNTIGVALVDPLDLLPFEEE